ncbi:cation:proton antiporter [Halobacteria archaeon AArc-m2/3/4]|uniref:Cation:proton antiporter n=1 Tax=Natronoglomus mannanivorans TaxID=2979990 RepID=A0AAP2Z140_9EURY|nr:cation:proton antiporter [Halobacteria archaeon AArc-xg1-1]MCU4974119.1 cation:proton antiporter [Halobacteria archaeon AArc-m2/3/4]
MADQYDDTYTESQVILTSVKIIAPFTLTYGLFMTFHGADTPGGSFQGGAIIGVTILMLAFAFGIEPTRQWLSNSTLVALIAGGVSIFLGVGLATMALGGAFLEYELFDEVLGIAPKWGMETIEIGGIALIVAGVVITLFFATASGFTPERGTDSSSSPGSVAGRGGDRDSENGGDDDD